MINRFVSFTNGHRKNETKRGADVYFFDVSKSGLDAMINVG